MQVQKVFQAGNSQVVAIPKSISRDLSLKKGAKVVVDRVPNGEAFVVRKVSQLAKSVSSTEAKKEFDKWLKVFMKENGEILDELAVR
jgi:antitoxin component of MazEF toxin-antitoxin module